MSGRILHEPAPPPHTCAIPGGLFGVISTGYRAGTVWQCDCKTVWVVEYEPPRTVGNMYMAGGNSWRRETRRERRRRLGVRWWQREGR